MPLAQTTCFDAGPVGPLQMQIWLQNQLADNGAYNIPTALRLRGPLNFEALQSGLSQIVARHESLRTRFLPSEIGPRQLIYPAQPFSMARHSLAHLRPDARELSLRSELRTQSRRPFNLERDLMIRAVLFHLSDDEHVLLISTHHIASDGLSVANLLKELKAFYESNLAHSQPDLPDLPIQYADFSAWQSEQLQNGEFNDQLAYWKRELTGELPSLDLPLDHPRTSDSQFEGDREWLDFPSTLGAKLQESARQFRVTEFTILFSAFNILLARYCNQSEMIIGTVVAGRNRVELDPLIGFLVNLIPIRTRLGEETSAAALFDQVHQQTLKALAHQDVPFDQVVAALGRPPGAAPLVQAVFSLENTVLTETHWGPLAIEWINVTTGTAKFDLNLTIQRNGSALSGNLEYRTALFNPSTIQRLFRHYVRLLESLFAAPRESVWRIPMLSPEEQFQIVESWNATDTAFPRDRTIADLFHAQVLASPRSTALFDDSETLTYQDLESRSDALASHLINFGAGPGRFVAICMERSIDLIVSFLAVIKSGAAYVPLDPDHPEERLELLLRDCAADIILTHQQHSRLFPHSTARVLSLDAVDAGRLFEVRPAAPPSISPESPACVMYTSGSTGVPKGVVIPHRAVVRLVRNTNFADLGPDQTFLQFAPASFDASTLEIWAPLLNGGKLCLAPPGKLSLEDLGRIIRERRVTTLWLTTALFNLMVEEHIDSLKSLQQLLTGGDAASFSHFCKFQAEVPSCRLINGYGPTENTTFTACKTVLPDTLHHGFVPIGKPISNTRVYILDRFLQPVPIGVAGEIFTSGDGLALEYLHAPELTAEKFLPHPFRPAERFYRTGDHGRFLPNGDIQFLGRLDQQVKIRGYRIELGEIEHAVRLHPAVRDAAVVLRGENPSDKHLVCCWIPQSAQSVDSDSFRFFLKQKLPDYSIPSHFILLEKFPVTASGKLDRKALISLLPALTHESHSSPIAAQLSPLEETLLDIWRDVLGNPGLGPHEDFFSLGGHSLLATQLISRINKQLNVRLPLRMIFDHSTVAELALAASDPRHSQTSTPIRPRSSPFRA